MPSGHFFSLYLVFSSSGIMWIGSVGYTYSGLWSMIIFSAVSISPCMKFCPVLLMFFVRFRLCFFAAVVFGSLSIRMKFLSCCFRCSRGSRLWIFFPPIIRSIWFFTFVWGLVFVEVVICVIWLLL